MKPTKRPCPSQTHNQQCRKAHCWTPTSHSASFTFFAVPENMAASLTNVPEPRRTCPDAAGPLLLQITVNIGEDFPVIVGAGIGSHSRHSESTGRHLRTTNTAAYSRRPQRTGALSFKTFPYSVTFAPRIDETSSLGSTAENKHLLADDKYRKRDMLRIPHEHHEASTVI